MNKKILVAIIILVVIAAGVVGIYYVKNVKNGQKIYHIGIVSGMADFDSIAVGFKQGMTGYGYIEGKNIVYDLQKFDSNPEGVKKAIKKFVEDKVDLILSFSTAASIEAKSATKGTNIPVVFALATTEKNGLVDNIRQPGGNITGVRYPLLEETAKRLELLHEVVPGAKRIYLVYDINYPNTKAALEVLRSEAPSLGVTLVEDSVSNLKELKAVLNKRAALKDIGIDAILIMPDVLSNSVDGTKEIVVNFADKHKLPVGGCTNNTADAGAIFSFFPDNINMGVLAAASADKILKGTPAGTISVVSPEAYLRISYKTIQSLGLTISKGILGRANEVIK
jgi:putative tryptophan/tyrosine transport system substrate-binding protein